MLENLNYLTMKQLFKLLPFLFLCISCDEIVYYDITDDKKPLLETNDTILFYSNLNNTIDTFVIKRTDEYIVHDKKYYHEFISCDYNSINLSKIRNSFSIQQGESIRISSESQYYQTIYQNDTPKTFKIDVTTYTDVFKLERYNSTDTIPKTIYYSYKDGIIRYDYSDSLYYYRKK
ncbi:MAG: hypothetical protein BWY22_00721 [Bacteroidetes bacterium ADurb.Bin217]|nr:MAG: hypothetical protein BWY22_00721 [Bacteroidetes bacterium ADurb.Bin217]